MVNKEKYIGLGLDTDTAPDKRQPDTYWDAENIHIINNGRNLSIKPIQGETHVVDFTAISSSYVSTNAGITNFTLVTPRKIIGTVAFRDKAYIFTYFSGTGDPGATSYSINELFSLSSTGTLTLIAIGQWDIPSTARVDGLVNYENDATIKLYWTDGINPLRFLNVASPLGLIENNITVVEEVSLSNIDVSLIAGGNLTAGSIQYVYNYYNYKGVQTALSSASTLIPITKVFNGYSSEENTGLKAQISFTIDTDFDAVRIYSIHYQELDQTPVIRLIYESALDVSTSTLTIYDSGETFIAEYTVQELLNITAQPIVANTLATKRDRLFLGNYSISAFNPNIDARAYGYPISSTSTTIDGSSRTKAQLDAYSATADGINTDLVTRGYKYNSTAQGATGYNFEIGYATTILPDFAEAPIITIPPKSLKKFEIYRLGIVFYNKYGQRSPVKWMTDIQIPDIKDGSDEVSTGINLKLVDSAAVARLVAEGIVYYQLCIVKRNIQDRTILSQGFLVPGCKYTINGTGTHYSQYVYPYYCLKTIDTNGLQDESIAANYINNRDWSYGTSPNPYPLMTSEIGFFYSTDTAFEANIPMPTHVRILGESVVDYRQGETVLRMYINDTLQYQEILDAISTIGVLPYWGARSEVGFPYHIMDQSTTIPNNPTDIITYEVVRSYRFSISERFAYDDTDRVVILNTGYPSAISIDEGELKFLDPFHTIKNGTEFPSLINVDTSKLATSYYNTYAKSIVLNFIGNTWHTDTLPFDKFDSYSIYGSGQTYLRGLPLVEILQTVTNQYGGNTYEAKQNNEYLPLGKIQSMNTTAIDNYVGDVWVGPLSINRSDGGDNKSQGQMNIYEYVYVHFAEHNHNIYARKDFMQNFKYTLDLLVGYKNYRIADNHSLLSAYNQVENIFKYYPVPFNFSLVEDYPVSIISSNPKTPNELLDSWLIFNPNNTKLLEGQYGNITKLHNLAGELLALQTQGIALIEIEPRVQTTDTQGIGIYLGIGELFYNHKYLITNGGATDKFTVADDGKELYYYDGNLNILSTLHEGKFSISKLVQGILNNNTTGPHSITFYNKKSHMYFQYRDFTLVYDIISEKFIAKYTFFYNDTHTEVTEANKWLLPLKDSLYQLKVIKASESDTNGVEVYTQYTGEHRGSKIVYLMCPNSIYEKVFHNLEYRLTGNDFTSIKVNNDINQSATVTPDTKIKFDMHRLHLPRIENSRERFRGIYIFVELNNTDDFSLDNIVLMYNLKG